MAKDRRCPCTDLQSIPTMKRRDIKKQIRRLEFEVLPWVIKFLKAGPRVHRDVLATYENEIERVLTSLIACHLRLDPSWPRHERWFDGLEQFVWEKSTPVLSGRGELWWGHLSNIAGAEVKEHCRVTLDARKQKTLSYRIVVDHRTNGSRIRPQDCVLTRRSIRRGASCKVNRGSVIECERVGLIVGVDSLQQAAVLIRDHNKRLIV